MITGEEPADGGAFGDKVFQSFVGTLVQSLHELTANIQEFVRLGRALWPQYTSPIRPSSISKSLEFIRKARKTTSQATTGPEAALTEREVLAYLDQRIFPYVRYTI